MEKEEVEVLIIGSGFGGSVAALRFAEAGHHVTILERGGWISRENFEADDDMFWQPDKGRYGMNEIKKRGRHIIPWVGAAVGGGSHVYAGTLKRRAFFDDFPGKISVEEMAPYYEKAERMMEAMKYPDYPPYNNLPSYCVFREAEKKLKKERPDLVEDQGDILLAISYAPPGKTPGENFVNKYGANQKYFDPEEQSLLGGEIDVKNTLDKNYLFVAKKYGAVIHDFREVYKIENLNGEKYLVHWKNPKEGSQEKGTIQCKILICAAGSIGSSELLLQNKNVFKTLPKLSDRLGEEYHSNGDYVTFILPKKGLALSWVGLIIGITGWIIGNLYIGIGGLLLYLIGWILSRKKSQPDKGTTNSDFIRFKHRDGSTQGAYLEGGRYPTMIKATIAVLISLTGKFRPEYYKPISNTINWMGKYVPIFELIERSWPIPILMMGRDDASGQFYLNDKFEAEIQYPFQDNKEYTNYLNSLGKMFAKTAKSYFIPNGIAALFKVIEVPHNIGGVPMGNNHLDGVVDTYGRVFNYNNLLVLDGSILPNSLGPNPVNTILAFTERSMDKVINQFNEDGSISTEKS
ncbi:NAD(P)-binding Rossmann-like domain-containing protein [Flavobacteriaceae bacterium MAR_2010_188]|nr:NAD(P)-binding Rossmann-like domain-containing protein [Flavobacteriaceae bacterium MAR_2010_188]